MEPFFLYSLGQQQVSRGFFPPNHHPFSLANRREKLHLHLGGGEVAGSLSAGLVPRWEVSEIPR